jgi:hypothetical protein
MIFGSIKKGKKGLLSLVPKHSAETGRKNMSQIYQKISC